VVDIADYNYLEHYGENMYQLVDGGRVTPADVEIYQGVLEMSNVNVVSEMVEMITVTRAYESNQKVIQTIDETIDKAVNSLGRVG
jgi:flagellar basal-body rod protein FlgG